MCFQCSRRGGEATLSKGIREVWSSGDSLPGLLQREEGEDLWVCDLCEKKAAQLALKVESVEISGSVAVIKPFKMNSKKVAHVIKGSGRNQEGPKYLKDDWKAKTSKSNPSIQSAYSRRNSSKIQSSWGPRDRPERHEKLPIEGQGPRYHTSEDYERRPILTNPFEDSQEQEEEDLSSYNDYEEIYRRDHSFQSQSSRSPPRPYHSGRASRYEPGLDSPHYPRAHHASYHDSYNTHPSFSNSFSKQREPSYYYSRKQPGGRGSEPGHHHTQKQTTNRPSHGIQKLAKKSRKNRKRRDFQEIDSYEEQRHKLRQSELNRSSHLLDDLNDSQYSLKDRKLARSKIQTTTFTYNSHQKAQDSYLDDLHYSNNQNTDQQDQDRRHHQYSYDLRDREDRNFGRRGSANSGPSGHRGGQGGQARGPVYEETENENFDLGRHGQSRRLTRAEEELQREGREGLGYSFYEDDKHTSQNYSNFELYRGQGMPPRFPSESSRAGSDRRAYELVSIHGREDNSSYHGGSQFRDFDPIYEEEEDNWHHRRGFYQSEEGVELTNRYKNPKKRGKTKKKFLTGVSLKAEPMEDNDDNQPRRRVNWKEESADNYSISDNLSQNVLYENLGDFQLSGWEQGVTTPRYFPQNSSYLPHSPSDHHARRFHKMEYLDDDDELQARRLPQAIKAKLQVSKNHSRKNLKFLVKKKSWKDLIKK